MGLSSLQKKKIEKWVSLVVSRPGLVSHPTGWTLCGGCEQQSTGVISTNRVVVVVCCLVDAIVGWKTNKRMKKKKMKSHLEEDPKECLRDLSRLAGVHEQRCFLLVQPSCSFAAHRRRHQEHGNKGAANGGPGLLLGSHAHFLHAATWLQTN